jgi:hypothetical protein
MEINDRSAQIVKYVLLFWSVCVVSGVALAIGLANADMKIQDAANTGLAVAFMPGIIVIVLAGLAVIFG